MPSIKLVNPQDSSIIIAEVPSLTLEEISQAFIKAHGLPTSSKVLIKYTDADNDVITATTSEELVASAAHQMGNGGRSVPTFSIAIAILPSPPTQAVDGDKLLKRMAARAERQAQRREAHHGFGGRGPNPPPAFSGAEAGETEAVEDKGVATTTTTTTTTTTPVGEEHATGTAAAAEAESAVEGERRRKVRWDEGERMQKKFLKWMERKLKRRGEGGEKGKGQRGRSHSKSHSSSDSSSSGSSSSPSPSHSRRGGKSSHSSLSPSRLGRGHRHCATDDAAAASAPHSAWKQCKEGGKGHGGGSMRRMKHKVRAWLAEKMGWVVDGRGASHHHGHHHHHHYHHHHEGVCAAK